MNDLEELAMYDRASVDPHVTERGFLGFDSVLSTPATRWVQVVQ